MSDRIRRPYVVCVSAALSVIDGWLSCVDTNQQGAVGSSGT